MAPPASHVKHLQHHPTRPTAALLVLLLCATLISSTPALASGALLRLSHSTAVSGDTVSVQGVGFPANSRGTLTVHTDAPRNIRSNKQGAFTVTITAPKTTSTRVQVTATFGSTSASTSLSIWQPEPTPDPAPAPPPAPTPEPAPAPEGGLTRYTFDATADGWGAEAADAKATQDKGVAAHGTGSLRLTRTLGSGWGGVRANDGIVTPRDIRAEGDTLEAWALVPVGTPGRNFRGRLEVQDTGWGWHLGTSTALVPGTWTRLAMRVPSDVAGSVRRLGVQFDVDDANAVVSFHLDTVQQRASISAPAPAPAPAPTPAPTPVPGEDALHRLARAELKVFTDWLARNNAKGYLGEVGWPNDADTDKWNAVAETWYRHANATDLWVTPWSTGEWWGNYKYAPYMTNSGGFLGVAKSQAEVIERHPSAGYRRGVNVSGAEFGAPGSTVTTSPFSNVNPGRHGTAYQYDRQESFDYLASRGIDVIRLPFRWERIQPNLGQALDVNELRLLTDAVGRAHKAGLSVILDVHNYGAYHLFDGTQGVRRHVGSPEVTHAHFGDLWRRLSNEFRSNPGVVAYGLMNEPVFMGATREQGAKTWETASQGAVDAIRATGDSKLIMVSTFHWSHVYLVPELHPTAWIKDPVASIRYEAHHYPQRAYANSYAMELDRAVKLGY